MVNLLLLPEQATSAGVMTANLGFPRIGQNRELKFALERFWSGEWDEGKLQTVARNLRQAHWRMQAFSKFHPTISRFMITCSIRPSW